MTPLNPHDHNGTPFPTETRRGRKRKIVTQDGLAQHIAELIPLRINATLQWTTRSLRELADSLRATESDASRNIVSNELQRLGFQFTRNRELPAGRIARDVDAQYEVVDSAISNQLASDGPVIFLTGSKAKELGRPMRLETSFAPPYEIDKIDANFEEVIVRLPDGTYHAYDKEPTIEEKKAIKRQKREATRLDLDILTTERDGGLFTAAVLEHWWRNMRGALFPKSDSLLLITHESSPDCISPGAWEWGIDRLAKKLGITITVGRLPPATWRFLVPQRTLFSFTWLRFKNTRRKDARFEKKNINAVFSVQGCLLSDSPCVFEEIKTIPLIGRDFPKFRRSISRRVRQTFCIHRYPPYGDWNYSFESAGEQQ